MFFSQIVTRGMNVECHGFLLAAEHSTLFYA